MKTLANIIFLLFGSLSLFAQEEIKPDSIQPPSPALTPTPLVSNETDQDTSIAQVLVDSTAKTSKKKKFKVKGFLKKDYPIPKRAMLLSFAIPGAGQAYNKKWWKIPIAVGGTGTAIFFIRENTKTYRHLRDQVRLRYDEDLNIVRDLSLDPFSVEDLERVRDQRNKWKESSYIALILVQALGGVDAFVDAHMHGYKINEDLSMKIKPTMESTSGFGPAVGIGVNFKLTDGQEEMPKDFDLGF